MAKTYVLIKDTKEKLEVISVDEKNTFIRNSKGQEYNVPNCYLISLEKYNALKILKKVT